MHDGQKKKKSAASEFSCLLWTAAVAASGSCLTFHPLFLPDRILFFHISFSKHIRGRKIPKVTTVSKMSSFTPAKMWWKIWGYVVCVAAGSALWIKSLTSFLQLVSDGSDLCAQFLCFLGPTGPDLAIYGVQVEHQGEFGVSYPPELLKCMEDHDIKSLHLSIYLSSPSIHLICLISFMLNALPVTH